MTENELDVLVTLSDDRWHRASPGAFFLHRKGLVDRRGTSELVNENSRYEYRINEDGKRYLTET